MKNVKIATFHFMKGKNYPVAFSGNLRKCPAWPLNTFLVLLTCTLLFPAIQVFSQDDSTTTHATRERYSEPREDWTKRFFTGGGLGLQFGSYTYIAVSPILGYRFTDKFSGGVGASYIYLEDRAYDFSTSVYGGKMFAEYDVFRGIAPHVEYEWLNLEVFDTRLNSRRRINVDSFLVGASYTQAIGEHSGIYIMLLYNLIESVYSPYENPVLRIGFNVGL